MKDLQARTYHLLSVMYDNNGDFKRSLEYSRLSVELSGNRIQKAVLLNYLNMYDAYRKFGDYPLAHVATDSVIIIAKLLGDNEWLATGYAVKGNLFFQQNDPNKARNYTLQAIKLAELDLVNSENLDRHYIAMSGIYSAIGDLDSAAFYAEKALIRAIEISDDRTIYYVHISLGKIERKRANYQKSYAHYTKAIQYTRIANSPTDRAFVYLEMAQLYSDQSDRINSLSYIDSSIEISTQIEHNKLQVTALNQKSKIFSEIGDYTRAIDLIQKSMTLSEKLGESEFLRSKKALAELYFQMDDHQKAINLYKQVADDMDEKGFQSQSGYLYLMVAESYMILGNFIEAEKYLQEAYSSLSKYNEPVDMYLYYLKYAQLSLKKGDLKSAGMSANKALELGNRNEEAFADGELFITLSEIELLHKDYNAALKNVKQAIEMSFLSQKVKNLIRALKLESQLYEKSGKYDSAYMSYIKYIHIRDSIFNVDTKNELTRRELQFEFEKKESVYKLNQKLTENDLKNREQELELSKRTLMLNRVQLEIRNKDFDLQHLEHLRTQAELNNQTITAENRQKENEIKSARIALLAKQRELQQKKLNDKIAQRNAFVVISLVLVAFSFIVLRSYSLQKKSGRIISEKNIELSTTLDDLKRVQFELVEMEQEKRLAIEKSRIARDMHDELGAGLTKISILTELLRTKSNGNVKQIDEISRTAGELVDNMSQIIWTMNPDNDKLENLFGYIRKYSLDYFEDSPVHCTVDIPLQTLNLHISHSVRRNVFLVIKEVLNNIMKHSGATDVRIAADYKDAVASILIQDNGKGFDLVQARTMGNGLNSIYKRMEVDGCDLDIRSIPGRGTEVCISCELNNYEKNTTSMEALKL